MMPNTMPTRNITSRLSRLPFTHGFAFSQEIRKRGAHKSTSRYYSSHATAAEAAERLLTTFSNKSYVRRQTLDGNQLQKLGLTLGRRDLGGVDITTDPVRDGTPIPPGWHLVYFTPNGTEPELGPDGTDQTFNAAAPFTRRMWAGGRITWPASSADGSDGVALRVGDEVEETTRLLSATPKKSRSGDDMVLVEVEKAFRGPRGLSITDQRSWIFRPEASQSLTPPSKLQNAAPIQSSSISSIPNAENNTPVWQLRWSPVGLFRFSALTFNAHMIHYNEYWTNQVEGHPGEVVHGPLNLINILNYWGDVHGKGDTPREITYRALSPIYAGEVYEIRTKDHLDDGDVKQWDMAAEKGGKTCMKATIKL